jgi:hypothetical protein
MKTKVESVYSNYTPFAWIFCDYVALKEFVFDTREEAIAFAEKYEQDNPSADFNWTYVSWLYRSWNNKITTFDNMELVDLRKSIPSGT